MSEAAQKLGEQRIELGSAKLSRLAFLAPMSGVTDVAMRRIALRFGAGLVVSEMVASDDYVLGSEEARLRAEGSGVETHVVQLAGRDPYWLGEAARLAEGAGAQIVDINMGCPAKRVTGGLAGSALMRDLDLAQRLIEATVAAVKIPVTLKMRLGWDSTSLNAPELARRAVSCGVQMLTVHGRTRAMFYKGKADWTAIRTTTETVAVPVVANGDCASSEDARMMLEKSGAQAVMVGRAALGRPWLVGQIAHELSTGIPGKLPSAAERADAAVEHFETLLELMGVEKGLRHARKHLAAYADHAADGEPSPGRQNDRARLVTSESVAETRRLLVSMFENESRQEAA